jgi:PAS domain S-box-containing protein
MFASADSEATEPDVQSENWFRLIVEAAPNAIVIVAQSGRITLVNRKAEALFGYTREALVGMDVSSLVPQRFRTNHGHHVLEFFASPETRAMGVGRELFGVCQDGTEVPIEIGLNPIETTRGCFTVASIIDISARRQAERQLRLVVDAVPNAMLLVDAFGRMTFVNRNAEALFGYTRDELVGQPLEKLVPERVRKAHPHHVRDFFAAPKARPMGAGRELHGCRKDGSEMMIEIGLNPIETSEGLCTLASIIDVTERRRQQDELKRSNSDLEQFAYIASHDLQEPLRMVASYTELLAQRYEGKLDAKADKYIYYAVDGARRMQRLVADLLQYSRVGSQGKPLVVVKSGDVLRRVLTLLGEVISSAGATIEYDEMPEVMADEAQLNQLFQNLIGNAIKFRSSEPPRIRIDATFEDRMWKFSIRDNGIGIEMRFADRIFQMFQRLHERGKYEGSGIGLAIAKRIVERHGGRISVESESGVGTTVFFTLPAITGAGGARK